MVFVRISGRENHRLTGHLVSINKFLWGFPIVTHTQNITESNPKELPWFPATGVPPLQIIQNALNVGGGFYHVWLVLSCFIMFYPCIEHGTQFDSQLLCCVEPSKRIVFRHVCIYKVPIGTELMESRGMGVGVAPMEVLYQESKPLITLITLTQTCHIFRKLHMCFYLHVYSSSLICSILLRIS